MIYVFCKALDGDWSFGIGVKHNVMDISVHDLRDYVFEKVWWLTII